MQCHAHGAFAHAQPLADGACTVALDRDGDDDRALPLGQGGQHLVGVEGRAFVVGPGCRERLGLVFDVDLLAKAAPPQMIDQLVTGDRVQPRSSGWLSSQLSRFRCMASNVSCTMSSLSSTPNPARASPRRATPRSHIATWPSSCR